MKKYLLLIIICSLTICNLLAYHYVPEWTVNPEGGQNPWSAQNVYIYSGMIMGRPISIGDEFGVFDEHGTLCGAKYLSSLDNYPLVSIICSTEGGGVPGSAVLGDLVIIKVWDGTREYAYPEMSVHFIISDYSPWSDAYFKPSGSSHIPEILYETPLAVSTKTLNPPPGPGGGYFQNIIFDDTNITLKEAWVLANGGGNIKVYAFDEFSTDEYYAPGSPGGTVPNPDISPYGWFIDSGNIQFYADNNYPVKISFTIPPLPAGYTLNESTLGIYYRKIHGTGAYTLVPGTYDAANGLITVSITDASKIKGEYILTGFKQESALSVELTSFFATISNQNKVNLNWVSQTETDLIGYYVLRGTEKELSNACIISPLINATNTSQPKAYIYTDNELNMSGTYNYWLQYNGINGTSGFNGPIEVNYEANTTSGSNIPLITSLDNVYPNPFNPIAYIPFSLETQSEVKINIYNTRGQIVKTFDLGTQEKGHHRITWDGSDNNGNLSGNGIYYIVMKAGKESFQRKAVLMK